MDEQVRTLGRVLEALREAGVRCALVGGHAVSAHTRPRVTEDVDLVVDGRRREEATRALVAAGFEVRAERDVLRAFVSADAPSPVADLLLSESSPVWGEALRTAVERAYQGTTLNVATRPALVAMKFVSAVNKERPQEDRLQDVSDIGRLVKQGWREDDAAEARRIADLSYPGAAAELQRLVDDLLAGRPVSV
jgi:hypothetical protein